MCAILGGAILDGTGVAMKIVSFGDVHMATRNLERMSEVLRDTDLVIVSGDLTNFGGVEDARKVIDDVRRACPRVLAVSGNLDKREVIPYLESEGVTLHGKGVVLDGLAIFGCGGPNAGVAWVRVDKPRSLDHDRWHATPCAGVSGPRRRLATAAIHVRVRRDRPRHRPWPGLAR